ncbi:MAG: hypothetical protein JWM27_2615 [Gemmatimonadetes bacterium]|nr:hypothetical protein [Gemmatimonadota bacterium]
MRSPAPWSSIRIALALLAGAGLASTLAAQAAPDPRAVQPERPTVATHAGTVAPGYIEVETGVEADRLPDGVGRQLGTPTVVKVGLAPRVQLNVGTAFLRLSGGAAAARSGIGDVSVGVKWRVADAAPLLGRFAVLPSVDLPTGSAERGTGAGTTGAGLLLISSHQAYGVAVDLNAGYTRRGGDGTATPRDATVWTASFGAPVRGPAGLALELFGYPGTSGPAGAAPTTALLVGPTFLVRPWLALDAGVIRRLSGPQPNALYAGLVYNAGKIPTGRPTRR